MRKDIEKLMALHDGELADQEGADTGDLHLDDPESQEFLEKLAKADKAFADAADELLEMPVPSKLIEAIHNPELQSEAEPEPKTAEIIPFPGRRSIVGFAIAAGLAAVIATNTQLFQSPVEPIADSQPAGYAALLQEVMESVPSGEAGTSDDGAISIMPMLSFKTDTAAYCREFMTLRNGTEFSGVACRDGAGSWELLIQEQTLTAPGGEGYRAAEGQEGGLELPPEVVKAAELSYAEEQAAIRSGWNDSGL